MTNMSENKAITPDRILNIEEVVYRTGVARATIYRMIKREEFPRQLQVAPPKIRSAVHEDASRCVGNQVYSRRQLL